MALLQTLPEIVAMLGKWLLENALSIATFLMSTIIALYLRRVDRRRNEREIKQIHDFNTWMKEQTQRQVATLEAVMSALPKAEREELTKEIASLLPESVRIGEVTIARPSLRIAQDLLGGEMYIEARAFGDEGERLNREIKKLREGLLVQFESPKHSGLTEIRKIEITTETTGGVTYYVFYIWVRFVR